VYYIFLIHSGAASAINQIMVILICVTQICEICLLTNLLDGNYIIYLQLGVT